MAVLREELHQIIDQLPERELGPVWDGPDFSGLSPAAVMMCLSKIRGCCSLSARRGGVHASDAVGYRALVCGRGLINGMAAVLAAVIKDPAADIADLAVALDGSALRRNWTQNAWEGA